MSGSRSKVLRRLARKIEALPKRGPDALEGKALERSLKRMYQRGQVVA